MLKELFLYFLASFEGILSVLIYHHEEKYECVKLPVSLRHDGELY